MSNPVVPITSAPSIRKAEADTHEWAEATVDSLQRGITNVDPDASDYKNTKQMVDKVAESFANADPVNIADYFEAVQALGRLQGSSILNENYEPTAEEILAAA